MGSLSFWDALALDVAIWATWSTVVGWWAARWSPARVDVDGWLTRLRAWERQGRLWTRVGVRRWKRWLPDAGTFRGGRRKVLNRSRDRGEWRAISGETRRAERVHWWILLAFPAEVVIHRGVVLVPMGAYALIANAPCIVAQRYNRGRLATLLARPPRAARPGS